jgi:hypothetical protein
MSAFTSSAVLQRAFLLTVSLVLVSGVILVPWLLTFSNFMALAAFVVGASWVFLATFKNAQPASSLAQSLHDSDAAALRQARRR